MYNRFVVTTNFDVYLYCKCGHKLRFTDGYGGVDNSDPITKTCFECNRKWVVTVSSVEVDLAGYYGYKGE